MKAKQLRAADDSHELMLSLHAGQRAAEDRQAPPPHLPITRLELYAPRVLVLAWVDVLALPPAVAALLAFLVPVAPSLCLTAAPVPPAGLEEAGRVALCCFLACASRGPVWLVLATGLVAGLSEQIQQEAGKKRVGVKKTGDVEERQCGDETRAQSGPAEDGGPTETDSVHIQQRCSPADLSLSQEHFLRRRDFMIKTGQDCQHSNDKNNAAAAVLRFVCHDTRVPQISHL